jgi:hypothetical protein
VRLFTSAETGHFLRVVHQQVNVVVLLVELHQFRLEVRKPCASIFGRKDQKCECVIANGPIYH